MSWSGRIATLGRSRWTPSQLSSAVAWWDATQGVTQSSGAVSAWADRVGGNSVTQATGSLKPLYSDTAINSLYPGITFDGSDDVMSLVGVPAAFPTGAASGWIFVLGSQDALAADTTIRIPANYGTSGANAGRIVERTVVTGVNRGGVENNTAATKVTTVDLSGVNAVLGSFTSVTQQSRVNGSDSTSDSVTTNTATTRIRIGAWCDTAASLFWKGPIAQVLVGTGALSTAEKEKLEAWALWSVGQQAKLPGGHTYATTRP